MAQLPPWLRLLWVLCFLALLLYASSVPTNHPARKTLPANTSVKKKVEAKKVSSAMEERDLLANIDYQGPKTHPPRPPGKGHRH